MELQRTLVLIKPDGVERGLVGQILSRFELAGLKIIALKLVAPDVKMASAHYTEDIAKRNGQHVRDNMIQMLSTGPVVAIALEGVESIELVRKMVGPTQPSAAAPGTIRGDFAHANFAYSDAKNIGLKNVVHASSSVEDATSEIGIWFTEAELVSYRSVHDTHILS